MWKLMLRKVKHNSKKQSLNFGMSHSGAHVLFQDTKCCYYAYDSGSTLERAREGFPSLQQINHTCEIKEHAALESMWKI